MKGLQARAVAAWREMLNAAWGAPDDEKIVKIALLPGAYNQVIEIARNGTPSGRERAALALFLCGTGTALETLQWLVRDPNDRVREAAAEVLVGFGLSASEVEAIRKRRLARPPAPFSMREASIVRDPQDTRSPGSSMYDW